MTQLGDIPEESDPVHLLLIADSKMGKSTYAAQAVLDGWRMIYVDADNGISAVRHAFKGSKEALNRVLYFRTDNPCKLIENMLTMGIFRWNITRDSVFSSGASSPSDKIVEIKPSRIPRNIILNIDSWTSVAADAMDISAGLANVDLASMKEGEGEGVYGGANKRLTLLCAILQHARFHVIVQAHGTLYERMEKPAGVLKEVKRSQMILKETIKIPVSSSRPHGHLMAKYFNQIGWIELDRADRREMDFKVKYDRVGGGTPNDRKQLKEMGWSDTFGKPPVYDTPLIDSSWIRYLTAEEFSAEQASATSKPTGVTVAGTIAKTPAQQTVSALMKKPTIKQPATTAK